MFFRDRAVGVPSATWNADAPMVAAIIAGGRVDGELAAALGTPIKALARVGAGTLLDMAIAAARGGGAARVAVIGGAEVRDHCASAVDAVVDESVDGGENLRRAFGEAVDAPLLLLASDLPFVAAASIAAFLAAARGAGLAMPLADADAYRAAFPGAPAHHTNLAGERVVNGSVFYFGPGVATRVLSVAQQLFAARKNSLGMARLLGAPLLVRFALGRLRVEDIEARAFERLGLRARAVRGSAPDLCYDVDTLTDYRYAVARAARG
jgi:GTP:adenosylcobinamide-phosphate guanylyltransferase